MTRKRGKLFIYTRGCGQKVVENLVKRLVYHLKPIAIEESGLIVVGVDFLSDDEAEQLAIDDGFFSYDDLLDFFKMEHGLPFYGYLIKW